MSPVTRARHRDDGPASDGGMWASWLDLDRGSFACAVVSLVTIVKLLLVPSYHSTDFEVHRNWLAITSSLPPSRWYFDATSEWTLDYPPLFACFEWALARAAPLFDARMLELERLDHASAATVLFQRLTVVACDAALVAGAWACGDADRAPAAGGSAADARASRARANASLLLVVGSAGLLIVDHIHFQYNGAAPQTRALLLRARAAETDRANARHRSPARRPPPPPRA